MSFVTQGAAAFLADREVAAELLDLDLNLTLQVRESMPFRDPDIDLLNPPVSSPLPAMRKDPGETGAEGALNFVLQDVGVPATAHAGIANIFENVNKAPFSFIFGSGAVAQEGDEAILWTGVQGDRSFAIRNGDLLEISLAMGVDGAASWGNLLAIGRKQSSGNGSAVELGAMPAGGELHGVLHIPRDILTLSGTIAAEIESSPDQGFSTPTQRLTFTIDGSVAAGEHVIVKSVGGWADTWYRAKWAGAATPDHYIALSGAVRAAA